MSLSKIVAHIHSTYPTPPDKLYWDRDEWDTALGELLEMRLVKERGLLAKAIDERNVLICGIPVIPKP